jgi:hypothetical protein
VVAVEQWAAGGEIDQGVATIALHLLEPVRVAGDDGTGGGSGNGNGKGDGKGKGNGGDD